MISNNRVWELSQHIVPHVAHGPLMARSWIAHGKRSCADRCPCWAFGGVDSESSQHQQQRQAQVRANAAPTRQKQ